MDEVLLRDKKNRPLIIARSNGMIILSRYRDLSSEEKDKLVQLYDRVKNDVNFESNLDVRAFLDFNTEPKKDVCG